MRDMTVTAGAPAKPLTVADLIDTLTALPELPATVDMTRAEWEALRASPEVTRYLSRDDPGPFRLLGLPVRIVDNPITARLHRDWARVFGPMDNRVHRGEGDGRVQERQGGLREREGGQADGAGDPDSEQAP